MVDVSRIADQLKVSHVLEGSVRKSGGRVRMSAQLIDGRVGDHIWAERYDRDLKDIFALQDEISHAINLFRARLQSSKPCGFASRRCRGEEELRCFRKFLSR